MTLQELIARLEQEPERKRVRHGFTRPHSYRGYYEQLAFEPAENVTVGEMLAAARVALGATFTGYKGGEYTMGAHTDVYLAHYGDYGEELGSTLLGYMLSNPVASPSADGSPSAPDDPVCDHCGGPTRAICSSSERLCPTCPRLVRSPVTSPSALHGEGAESVLRMLRTAVTRMAAMMLAAADAAPSAGSARQYRLWAAQLRDALSVAAPAPAAGPEDAASRSERRDERSIIVALARCAMAHPTPAVRQQIRRLVTCWEERHDPAALRLSGLLSDAAPSDVRIIQSAPAGSDARGEEERERLAVEVEAMADLLARTGRVVPFECGLRGPDYWVRIQERAQRLRLAARLLAPTADAQPIRRALPCATCKSERHTTNEHRFAAGLDDVPDARRGAGEAIRSLADFDRRYLPAQYREEVERLAHLCREAATVLLLTQPTPLDAHRLPDALQRAAEVLEQSAVLPDGSPGATRDGKGPSHA